MKRLGPNVVLVVALLCAVAVAAAAADKPVLSIMCFQGYAEESWVKPFEQKYNCTVKIAYAGAVDEMFSKVKAAPADYNIVSIDPGRITMYKSAGLLQPVDTKKLANYSQMGAFFRNHPYNKMLGGGGIYHIPIVWGTQTITVNTSKLPAADLAKYVDQKKGTISLKALTAPEFKGQTAFFDESANVCAIAGIEIGAKDPFHFKDDEWQKVQDKLYAWKKNARTFTSGLDSEFSVLSSEDAIHRAGRQRRPAQPEAGRGGHPAELPAVRDDGRDDLLDRRLGHHKAHQGRLSGPGAQVHRHDDRRRRCRPSLPSSSASASSTPPAPAGSARSSRTRRAPGGTRTSRPSLRPSTSWFPRKTPTGAWSSGTK